jgi:hypothetical protein
MSDELVRYLTKTLDEAEAAANRVFTTRDLDRCPRCHLFMDGWEERARGTLRALPCECEMERDKLWESKPDQGVLRSVAATRTIVELHAPAEYWGPTLDGWYGCTSCGVPAEYPVQWPCATILAEAGRWGWEAPA